MQCFIHTVLNRVVPALKLTQWEDGNVLKSIPTLRREKLYRGNPMSVGVWNKTSRLRFRQGVKTVTKPWMCNLFRMRQILDLDPYRNQNAVGKQTSQESPPYESLVAGSLDETLERVRSSWEDNFWVKLEGKWRPEIPQSDAKSHSGSAKPIMHYLSSW
jgi:hypothetical protein